VLELQIKCKVVPLVWVVFDADTWLYKNNSVFRLRIKSDKKVLESPCYYNGDIYYLRSYLGSPTERCYIPPEDVEMEVRHIHN
jgi:hypothetical protein